MCSVELRVFLWSQMTPEVDLFFFSLTIFSRCTMRNCMAQRELFYFMGDAMTRSKVCLSTATVSRDPSSMQQQHDESKASEREEKRACKIYIFLTLFLRCIGPFASSCTTRKFNSLEISFASFVRCKTTVDDGARTKFPLIFVEWRRCASKARRSLSFLHAVLLLHRSGQFKQRWYVLNLSTAETLSRFHSCLKKPWCSARVSYFFVEIIRLEVKTFRGLMIIMRLLLWATLKPEKPIQVRREIHSQLIFSVQHDDDDAWNFTKLFTKIFYNSHIVCGLSLIHWTSSQI